jgi:NAD(P)-dependent dehydrogenase (short-subunit alcohol dehydrogenase family)
MTVELHDRPLADLLRLDGRVAIVTGGGKGIGAAISRRLAEAGARVVVADLDAAAAEAVAAELDGAACVADVADPDAGEAMVALAEERFGSVDVLVNNAGVYPLRRLAEIDAAFVERLNAINVSGTLLPTRAASARMVAQGWGRVINLSSVEAFHPAGTGFSTYGATKGAVAVLTKHLALELAPAGVTVNAISPGPIRTEGTADLGRDALSAGDAEQPDEFTDLAGLLARMPVGRLGLPDDIARVATFLATDAAAVVTGQNVLVDGGNLLA